MKEITLTPYSKFGENVNPKENYRQPFFKKWGNGKWKENDEGKPVGYAVKFILVANANFDIFAQPCKWEMTANENVNYQVKENINVPLRARDINLTGLPKNAFKAKVEMIEGGKVTIGFTTGEHKVEFPITYEDARDINIKALGVILKISEIEDIPELPEPDEPPEPEIPELPEPVEPPVTGFWDALKRVIGEFLNDNKLWFFLGFFVLGFIFRWWLF